MLAAAAALLFAFIVLIAVPLLGIALEFVVLFLLLSTGIVGRVVLRRPWIVEAVNLDSPERSASFAVKGWRRSGETIDALKGEIQATGSPNESP